MSSKIDLIHAGITAFLLMNASNVCSMNVQGESNFLEKSPLSSKFQEKAQQLQNEKQELEYTLRELTEKSNRMNSELNAFITARESLIDRYNDLKNDDCESYMRCNNTRSRIFDEYQASLDETELLLNRNQELQDQCKQSVSDIDQWIQQIESLLERYNCVQSTLRNILSEE